jgi:hypothetical protein
MTNHPNRFATYTVLDRDGDVLEQGCTLFQAAHVVLGYDGNTHEIRPAADGKGFDLWVSSHSRNSTAYNGLKKSAIFSLAEGVDMAHADIYRRVIRNADWWSGCRVLTDADYAAELAEINSDN